jgi:hypothetical protein
VTTFALVNQSGLTQAEMDKSAIKTQWYLNEFVKDWGREPVTVVTTPELGTWNIYITNQSSKLGISGYHNSINKLPTAFCRPVTAANRFGTYRPGRIWRGRVIWKESFRPGLLTVICHEAIEMLLDPFGETYSAPDSKGRAWRYEPADHVFGGYFTNADGCVYPDYPLPAFYDVNGVGKMTRLGAVKTPFTLTPKGYGFWLGPKTGLLMKL